MNLVCDIFSHHGRFDQETKGGENMSCSLLLASCSSSMRSCMSNCLRKDGDCKVVLIALDQRNLASKARHRQPITTQLLQLDRQYDQHQPHCMGSIQHRLLLEIRYIH